MKDHRIADKLIEQRFEEISKKTDALPKTRYPTPKQKR